MPSLASFLVCEGSVLDKSGCFRGIGEQHCIIIAKAITISSIQVDLKSVRQEKIQLDAQLTLCLHPHNVFISRFHEYRIVQDRWAGSFDFVPSLAPLLYLVYRVFLPTLPRRGLGPKQGSSLIPGSFTVVTVALLTVLQMQPLQRIKIADSCPSLRALSHLASLLLQTSGSLPELSKQRGL